MGLESINEKLLARSAGWEAMKRARQYLASGAVLEAAWRDSKALGKIQAGGQIYQAGLHFESELDIDNQCPCRDSRQSGLLCAHSVAVALGTLFPDEVSSSPKNRQPKGEPEAESAGNVPRVTQETKSSGPWFRHDDQAKNSLSIRFLLSPNSLAQWLPAELSLMLEVLRDGEAFPIMAMDRNKAYRISERDQELMLWLQQDQQCVLGPVWRVNSSTFSTLLEKLGSGSCVMLGRKQTIPIDEEVWFPPMEVDLTSSGELRLSLACVRPPQGFFPGQPSYVFLGDCLKPVGIPGDWLSLLQQPLEIKREEVPATLHRLERWAGSGFPIRWLCEVNCFEMVDQKPVFYLHLEGGLARMDARLKVRYASHSYEISPSQPAALACIPDADSPTRYILRNPSLEQEAWGNLVRSGFHWNPSDGFARLQGQESILQFLSGPYLWMQKEWQVRLEERLSFSLEKNIETIEPSVRVSGSAGGWFDFSVSYPTTSGEMLSQDEVWSLLRSGRTYQKRSKDGKVLLLDTQAMEEFQEVLVDAQPQQTRGTFRVAQAHASFLEKTFEENQWSVIREGSGAEGLTSSIELFQRFKASLPEQIKKIRDYQWQGVLWMQSLFEKGYGGILADDMGLGKTLQVITWMGLNREIARSKNEEALPCLVICPTSLVFNWVAECLKWMPGLKVLAVEGSGREGAFAQLRQHDVIVTSYALIRRDLPHYRSQHFQTIFLDEAQHIKNRNTQNAQAVKAVRADHRLVITGTPLENSVLDLWSIFDFLMPGYLGAAKDFKERYEQPILQGGTASLQRLRRRVAPFLLRRTKEVVRPEIPERLDHVLYCELSPEQRSVYQQVMELGRRQLMEIAGQKNPSSKSRMMVLTSILRMRQICCDARMAVEKPMEWKRPSAKLELFEELLDGSLDGGHRMLVFSQFVGMLSILRDRLEERSIDYCYLDGSTRQRGKVVERFEQSSIPVFLISLKAGGTGLNLTGADTVLHFDPWWNPAVESQATARAHRIGQKKVVNNYKLIARQTIEENILKMQSKKQQQLDAMLESGGHELGKSLAWDEIAALLDGDLK